MRLNIYCTCYPPQNCKLSLIYRRFDQSFNTLFLPNLLKNSNFT